uniref:7,8-didemethyl-8-hydroxy-5-deazariboflavin synthase CofG n=1 Tax=Kribbia dieselivorans TaxID=331526 RepID=UPI000A7A4D0F
MTSDHGLRRALARADRGVALDVAEATALLSARGDDLTRLCSAAARVRDLGLDQAGRPGAVTYSPKVFIPITRLCRDRCHYCAFVKTPAQLRAAGEEMFLSVDEVVAIARAGAAAGCGEALFTLGDRPEDRWPEAAEWLHARGYDSTLDYVRALAIAVLEETGLLPHLNPGVMSWAELARLKPVSPSMGMMLETTSARLGEPGGPHHGSPDKEDPQIRLDVLENAGRLNIPFTTGILVGIGETDTELAESIFAIREVARRHRHIQEVIVQNFRAKERTAMRATPDASLDRHLAAVAVTRLVLGPTARVQAPPNLVEIEECAALWRAGVDDFGGISPVTADHVNPERPWPSLDALRSVGASAGFELRPRLTVHPQYALAGEPWIDPQVWRHVVALRGSDGLLDPQARPAGLPWQAPDEAFVATGRTDLHTSIDTQGRSADRRSDFEDVYGDWAQVAAAASRAGSAMPARLDSEVREALAAA